jgi:hypothetical protein
MKMQWAGETTIAWLYNYLERHGSRERALAHLPARTPRPALEIEAFPHRDGAGHLQTLPAKTPPSHELVRPVRSCVISIVFRATGRAVQWVSAPHLAQKVMDSSPTNLRRTLRAF